MAATLIIIAAAAVVSSVLEFQKKGGSLALRFDELNVKLDAVLDNQKLLLDAISEVNDSVQLVMRATSMVPATTVALLHLRDVQRMYDDVHDTLSNLEAHKHDKNAQTKKLASYFPALVEAAINIKN